MCINSLHYGKRLYNTRKGVVSEIFEKNNDKIIENQSLNEYLAYFSKEQLTRLAITHVLVNDRIDDIFQIHNLKNKPKNTIISYINKDLNSVIEAYIKGLKYDLYNQLKSIVISGGNVKYKLNEFDSSPMLLIFLKKFALAKINYDKREKTLHIFIHPIISNIMKNAYENKKIIKENMKFNEIYDYVEFALEAYGLIELCDLHKMFESQIYKIDISEFQKIISTRGLLDEFFETFSYENKVLICGLEFYNEDEAFDFYNILDKIEYRKFSKKEFESFKNGSYLKELKSYKQLEHYLFSKFEITTQDMDNIVCLIIMDYITTAQISIEDANENFLHNIGTILEVTETEKNRIKIMLNNIFNEYPKWKKKGNI